MGMVKDVKEPLKEEERKLPRVSAFSAEVPAEIKKRPACKSRFT
jgi:hypothetical protein